MVAATLEIPVCQNHIYHCSAQELCAALDSQSVGLFVVDPPYGIGYKAGHGVTNGGKPRVASRDFGEDVIQTDWLPDAYRSLRDAGALYLFTRWDVMPIWMEALLSAGFKIPQRIIWDKLHWGGGNLEYYGSQVEDILFAIKGQHRLNWDGREGNVWKLTKLDTINNEGNYDNPTQKPQRLIERMLIRSSKIGDVVCDPFVGSGTTAAAAVRMQRKYIACDVSIDQVDMARERASLPVTFALPGILENV